MSNQLKKVVIAGAVAVRIGPGEVEIHCSSVGKDQLALATAIGQGGNQCTGIGGILLFQLCGEDRRHIQESRKRFNQEIRRASHKDQLVAGLSMGIQLRTTLLGHLVDHLGLTELPCIGFNVCGALASQIDFSLSERVQ